MENEKFQLVFKKDTDLEKIKVLIDDFISRKLREGYINLPELTHVNEPSKYLIGANIYVDLFFNKVSEKMIILKEITLPRKEFNIPNFADYLNRIIDDQKEVMAMERYGQNSIKYHYVKYDLVYNNKEEFILSTYFSYTENED